MSLIPPQLDLKLPGGVSMHFKGIPAGQFRMGQRGVYADEEPVHTVVIPHPFWMGETPVTQVQFAAFRPTHRNYFDGNPSNPAESLSWYDAKAYADWLSRVCRVWIPEGYLAALPLEAEWEYACRAGTPTQYHPGDRKSDLDKVGWYLENSGATTHPAGRKKPNDWGLFDMHGNIWEWCHDIWDAEAYKMAVDGLPVHRVWTTEPENRSLVLRGGAWNNSARVCRAAIRVRYVPSVRFGYIGFRLVLVPSPRDDSASEVQGDGGGNDRANSESWVRRLLKR